MRAGLFAAAAAAVLIGGAPAALADHKGKIAWVEDPAQGLEQARLTGKPAMLFFSADW